MTYRRNTSAIILTIMTLSLQKIISGITRIVVIAFVLTAICMPISAQELNCQVEINSEQVQGTNKSVFETLQSAIREYMNTNIFSTAQYATNEKIDCRLFFTIKEVNGETYSGDLQVQMTRPVYNSTYTTTVLNFKDTKLEFTYQENEPLNFTTQSMDSQLTAILNFYAYLFLALDTDTFAPNGGEPYYEVLKNIVQMAQSSGETGWRQFEDTKNRSAVLSAYTDPSTSGLRQMLYTYHRRGLDEMATSPDKGRANITESLAALTKVYQASPMSVGLSMFRDAKLDELVNVYSKAPAEERAKVYDLLQPLYPTDEDRLQKIKNGQDRR